MSKFTSQQKEAFLHLAERYDPAVHAIVRRGGPEDISIRSRDEARLLDAFADSICAKVVRDFPDHTDEHEDINADAELAVHMVADIVAEYEAEA